MVPKLIYIQILSVIVISLFSNIYSAEAASGFSSMSGTVRQADLIVEGYVEISSEGVQQSHSNLIAQPSTSVIFGFGRAQITSFRITRVFKGEAEPNRAITVLSDLATEDRPDSLVKKRSYLLFLNKVAGTGGYEVMNSGESHWMIFEFNGKAKLKTWYQDPRMRSEDEYLDYHEFTKSLKTFLSKLTLDPQKSNY